ncbi:hypothetical protein ABTM13_20385, partial [Acinetobacter baumannii]
RFTGRAGAGRCHVWFHRGYRALSRRKKEVVLCNRFARIDFSPLPGRGGGSAPAKAALPASEFGQGRVEMLGTEIRPQ